MQNLSTLVRRGIDEWPVCACARAHTHTHKHTRNDETEYSCVCDGRYACFDARTHAQTDRQRERERERQREIGEIVTHTHTHIGTHTHTHARMKRRPSGMRACVTSRGSAGLFCHRSRSLLPINTSLLPPMQVAYPFRGCAYRQHRAARTRRRRRSTDWSS